MYTKFLKRFFCFVLFLLVSVAGIIFIFDPFYHYHAPYLNLKAVLTQKEYQCIGTIKNFGYDSLIMGSSTAENYNNSWFDEAFGCTAIKAIKSSGTTSDLDYYLTEAFSRRELKNVFYSLDLFALSGDQKNFLQDGMPLYLYDENIWNDVEYFWNKDVLFKDIPYLLAENFLDDYDEGASYNWAQYKTFGREEAIKHYDRAENITPMKPSEEYQEKIDNNIDLLENQVLEHPDTQFYFIFPPYSSLWWDNIYRNGELEEYEYAAEAVIQRLIGYKNVSIHYFQNDQDIILNLDNYMDPIHFSADINHHIVEQVAAGNYRLTDQNYKEQLNMMKRIVREEIL